MNAKNIFYLSISFFLISSAVLFIYALAEKDIEDKIKPEKIDYISLFEEGMTEMFSHGYLYDKIEYSDKLLNRRVIFLTNDVNDKNTTRVMKKLAHLDKEQPGKPIDLFIDTGGGTGGFMLANYIQGLHSPVNTHALGWCSSAGTMILAAGTGKRYAYQHSRISVHVNPYTDFELDDDEDQEFTIKNQYQQVIEAFWKQYAQLPDRFFPIEKEKYYYLTSQEALKYKIIDEVIDRPKPQGHK